MPWEPKYPTEANQVKFAIKQKLREFDQAKGITAEITDERVEHAFKLLKGASGRKQAEAVLREIKNYDELKDIAAANFAGLPNNAPDTVRKAIAAAAGVKTALQSAAHLQSLADAKINGYLLRINGKYKRHMNGEAIALPVEDMVSNENATVGRHYVNAENMLPQGDYIEWYPVDAVKSRHKRFFTGLGVSSALWFTEGGTHDAPDAEWWKGSKPGDKWTWKQFQ
jgi:hypothetical protein